MRHVIEDFKPLEGYHSVSTSIRQVLNHAGSPFTEEMVFGMASGLFFSYQEENGLPLISGRTGVGYFEESLGCNLGISIEVQSTDDAGRAEQELRSQVLNDIPVIVYVDAKLLGCPGPAEKDSGPYSIVVFGVDDEEGVAFISDRHGMSGGKPGGENRFHTVSLRDLERSRGSSGGHFSPDNRWLSFDLSGMWTINRNIVVEAIRETCTKMSCPCIPNIGLNGIELFCKKLQEWHSFDDRTLRRSALHAYLAIHENGGTGGGAFRRMYGNFLKEGSRIVRSGPITGSRPISGLGCLEKIGGEYIMLSERWDAAAEGFLNIYRTGDESRLCFIAESIRDIFEKEKKIIAQLCRIFCE